MSQEKIKKLTPEQEALIPVYREKWQKIALSTERVDKNKASEAVKNSYALSDRTTPKIVFCESPEVAGKAVLKDGENEEWTLDIDHISMIIREPEERMFLQLEEQIEQNLWERLDHSLLRLQLDRFSLNHIWFKLKKEVLDELPEFENRYLITPELWVGYASIYDFCMSVLNCEVNQNCWSVFKSVIEQCGWIFDFEDICYICDRPRILSFDNQNRLHAEGAPAIQFADGYSFYAYHGIPLPEKYGKIHPNQWQASWLLKEENAELRRVLIQGIGYERIASELGAIELDSFQEYRLLKIDTDVDVEPIYMLKMICPSTGYIHVLRVPPNVNSAKEAIRWVNWGIDPEEFAVQT
ncbi:MAG: hypothetical protein U7127_29860 [Phormidium sp.]